MKKMNEYIAWSQESPKKAGVYYVLGEGMNGVQQRYFTGDSWKLKEGEKPIVSGSLQGYKGGITSVFLMDVKYSEEELKLLHYECQKMMELVAVKGDQEVVLANVLVGKNDKRHVVWTKPDDVLKDGTAEDLHEFAMVGEVVKEVGPLPKVVEEKKTTKPKVKETPKKVEKPAEKEDSSVKQETPAPTVKEPEPIVKPEEPKKKEEPAPVTAPVTEAPVDVALEAPVTEPVDDLSAGWGDDPIGVDDLPF